MNFPRRLRGIFFVVGLIGIAYNGTMNVVFDIGNVLCTFDPDTFLPQLIKDPDCIQALKKFYFRGLWKEYDRGYIQPSDLIRMGCKEYPQYEQQIRTLVRHWVEYVIPIPTSMALMEDLQKQGIPMYILSNIPEDQYLYALHHRAFMKRINGGVFSYQEKVIKPERKIYQILLDRYDLNPSSCLFIDDRKENIAAAAALGFETIHCTDVRRMPDQVREKLHEMQSQ
jgi:HAD superfamily hydrolase (TIGR01509 family)